MFAWHGAPAVARRRAPVETSDDAPMAYAPAPQYAPRGAIYQQPAPPGYPQYPQYPPLMRGFPLFGGN